MKQDIILLNFTSEKAEALGMLSHTAQQAQKSRHFKLSTLSITPDLKFWLYLFIFLIMSCSLLNL